MASNVLLLGVLYLQESSLISQHVHQQGQSSAKDVQLAGFLTFSTTTEAAKLVLSTAAVAVLTAAANAKFIGPSAPSHAPRGVSETRAVKWSNHVKLALPRCGSAGSGRDEPAPPRFLLSRE